METRIDRFGSVREDKIKQLKELIAESDNIVFLGGAGVSTESGIPDFRSGAGIYNTESGTKYRPIDIIAHDFFIEHPEDFYDFYKRKLIYPDARPNKAHKALVRLERQGKLKAIITQNIDNALSNFMVLYSEITAWTAGRSSISSMLSRRKVSLTVTDAAGS